MTRDELRAHLEQSANALAHQRDAIHARFAEENERGAWAPGTSAYDATDPNGTPILAPVLAAEGQVLAALAAMVEDVALADPRDDPIYKANEDAIAAEKRLALKIPPDELARFIHDADLRRAYLDGYEDGVVSVVAAGPDAEAKLFGHPFRVFVQWLDRAPSTSTLLRRLEKAQLRHAAAAQTASR